MGRVLAVLAADGSGLAREPWLTPLDLALLRGEAVFETARVYGGRPFRLDAHLARLAASAAMVDVKLPGGLAGLAEQAAKQAGDGDAVLRLVCTRGVEGELASTAFAIVTELPAGLEDDRRRGLRVKLAPLAVDPLVRAACPWLLPGAKSTSYAVNMATLRWAAGQGADDAVFVGLGGELLECPTANLWWRSGDILFTPSLTLGILAGVTRAALLELAPDAGYRVVDGVFTADDLAGADEAFLSSSTREVMPVVAVDGNAVGDGRPGPAAATLQRRLRALATASAEGRT